MKLLATCVSRGSIFSIDPTPTGYRRFNLELAVGKTGIQHGEREQLGAQFIHRFVNALSLLAHPVHEFRAISGRKNIRYLRLSADKALEPRARSQCQETVAERAVGRLAPIDEAYRRRTRVAPLLEGREKTWSVQLRRCILGIVELDHFSVGVSEQIKDAVVLLDAPPFLATRRPVGG